MILNATFEGVDDWSRCLIKTERGTILCDSECAEEAVILADPDRGHWHTINDWGEPMSPIKPEIRINLIEKSD